MSERNSLKALGTVREKFACGSPDWLTCNDAYSEITALRARLSSAEAERDRLREGLEPFVRHGQAMGVFRGDNGPYRYYTESGYREVPAENFRRARALLTPQADGTETR